MASSAGGDLVFLHRFEQGGLRLGGRAIDLVGQDHVCEHRSPHEHHLPPLACILQNLGAGDVRRHEVGRELDTLEFEMEDARNRFDQQRFGEAGRAGDEAMAAGEQRDEDLLDDLVLAHDHFGQFRTNLSTATGQAFDGFALRLDCRGERHFGFDLGECVH